MDHAFDLGDPLDVDTCPTQRLDHPCQHSRPVFNQPNGQVAGH